MNSGEVFDVQCPSADPSKTEYPYRADVEVKVLMTSWLLNNRQAVWRWKLPFILSFRLILVFGKGE